MRVDPSTDFPFLWCLVVGITMESSLSFLSLWISQLLNQMRILAENDWNWSENFARFRDFFPWLPSRDRLNEEGAVFVALQQWSSSFSALLFWQIDSCPPLPPTFLLSSVMSDVFEPYIPVSCIFLAILSQVLWGEEVSSRFHSRRRESCLFLFTSSFWCL